MKISREKKNRSIGRLVERDIKPIPDTPETVLDKTTR